MAHEAAIERLYELLGDLEQRTGGMRLLKDCDGRMAWPARGVYFFFENGELRNDGVQQRVVRIGTHGLRPSKSTLWGRLAQHRGTVGGRLPGGGNHRGSIFRLHVGAALLSQGNWPESIAESWAVGGSAPWPVRLVEHPLEKAVSTHIGSMPFLWVGVDDLPGPKSDRGVIERGAIALLSNSRRPVDSPSTSWLGQTARHEAIRESGLWNVNHVWDRPESLFLDVLRLHVERM